MIRPTRPNSKQSALRVKLCRLAATRSLYPEHPSRLRVVFATACARRLSLDDWSLPPNLLLKWLARTITVLPLSVVTSYSGQSRLKIRRQRGVSTGAIVKKRAKCCCICLKRISCVTFDLENGGFAGSRGTNWYKPVNKTEVT